MIDVDQLEKQAVEAAITLNWKRAIELNRSLVKAEKNNLATYLRLGYANMQLGQFADAKKSYNKALRLQPGNVLAKENLERIKILESRRGKKNTKKVINFDPNLFLEIPGRTKSAPLVNLGQKNVLAHLVIGEEIYLKPKSRKIEIRAKSNEYIGSLPDDLSKRLLLFIKAGSIYKATIKEISLSRVVVFISEEKKGTKVAHFTSFPKDTQKNLMKLEEAQEEMGEHDVEAEFDLEKLAESLSHDDKDYFHYSPTREDEDEENLEE